jgi:hypothetical protein
MLCAVLGVFGWLVFNRYFLSEEAKVRRAVMALKNAAEKNDRIRFADGIAQGYSDEWGWNKTLLLAGLSFIHESFSGLKVNISHMRVTVNDHSNAEAAMFVEVTGEDQRGVRQDLTQQLRGNFSNRLKLTLVKTPDGWKLKAAETMKWKFD